MYLHQDRGRGASAQVEVRGTLTRYTSEFTRLPRTEREEANRRVAAFADALARNLGRPTCTR